MAVGASTFNFAGGAVDDLFSVGAFKTKAKGFDLEAANYDAAAGMADQNADFTRISTGLKLMQIERQKFNVLGGQRADVASSGFAASGSAMDILRDSAQQGALQEAVAHQQGLVTEEGYRQQASSYRNMAAASRLAAGAAKKSASQAYWKAGIKTAMAVGSAFI